MPEKFTIQGKNIKIETPVSRRKKRKGRSYNNEQLNIKN